MDWKYKVETPCYVIDEGALKRNLELLKLVREKAGCKILLAQKAFSAFAVYPMIAQYLDGVTASGIYEAKLGYEEMAKPFGRENHVYRSCKQSRNFERNRIHSIRRRLQDLRSRLEEQRNHGTRSDFRQQRVYLRSQTKRLFLP